MGRKLQDMTLFVLQFGTVTSFARTHENGVNLWNVKCGLCGVVRERTSGRIRKSTGLCRSCMQRKEIPRDTVDGIRTTEYTAWNTMRERCGYTQGSKGESNYAGRGITVCESWLGEYGFDEFYKHIGKKPSPELSLDRINNDGNYEPGNVRWATRTEQNNNKSNNRRFTIDGITKGISQWCQDFEISRSTVRHNLSKGMSIEQALGYK